MEGRCQYVPTSGVWRPPVCGRVTMTSCLGWNVRRYCPQFFCWPGVWTRSDKNGSLAYAHYAHCLCDMLRQPQATLENQTYLRVFADAFLTSRDLHFPHRIFKPRQRFFLPYSTRNKVVQHSVVIPFLLQ